MRHRWFSSQERNRGDMQVQDYTRPQNFIEFRRSVGTLTYDHWRPSPRIGWRFQGCRKPPSREWILLCVSCISAPDQICPLPAFRRGQIEKPLGLWHPSIQMAMQHVASPHCPWGSRESPCLPLCCQVWVHLSPSSTLPKNCGSPPAEPSFPSRVERQALHPNVEFQKEDRTLGLSTVHWVGPEPWVSSGSDCWRKPHALLHHTARWLLHQWWLQQWSQRKARSHPESPHPKFHAVVKHQGTRRQNKTNNLRDSRVMARGPTKNGAWHFKPETSPGCRQKRGRGHQQEGIFEKRFSRDASCSPGSEPQWDWWR